MPREMTKRSKKAGLPPGTLVHLGVERTEKPRITILAYDESRFEEKEVGRVEEFVPVQDRPMVVWVNVDGIHGKEIIENIGQRFGIHPLLLEDIMNTDQRPKIEDFGDYIFAVLRRLSFDEKAQEISSEQITLIFGGDFVLSFFEKAGDTLEPVRERIRTNKGRLRRMGADYLAYSIIDTIVDHYFAVTERIGENIDALEDSLISAPGQQVLRKLQKVRNETLFLRKAVWPLREVISRLERGESPLIREGTNIYFRDIYDHTVQIIDTVETYRDMMSGMMDIYLSSISNRLNEVMKVLTIIATIFIPLTFIVGVYGMNFEYMPELKWRYGYLFIWLIMITAAGLMVYFFRKKKWI
jgi:magnesium transporter